MTRLQRLIGINRYAILRRAIFCCLGFHGSKVADDGSPANVCGWCAFVFNPNMYADFLVTLKDGEQYQVSAVNEFHAGSVVVYGLQDGGVGKIDGRTGKSADAVRVHRDNIASIQRIEHRGAVVSDN